MWTEPHKGLFRKDALNIANQQNMSNLTELPANLPKPTDDGLANHLEGMVFPEISLQSTDDKFIDTSEFKRGMTDVLFSTRCTRL